MGSDVGALVRRAAAIDYAIEKGFSLRLSDVNMLEYAALRILDAERARYEPKRDN